MLSGDERRALDAIDKYMLADDPQLCRALQMGRSATLHRWKLGTCLAGIALGAIIVAAGVLLLSLGIMVFGCLIGSMGVLAFVRVRSEAALARRAAGRDPGGDISPTWRSPA